VSAGVMARRPSPRQEGIAWQGARASAALLVLLLTLLASSAPAASGPATPNPMCPRLDTWNPQGIKGPNRIDHLIVRFPAGHASQRGGTCSVMVEASHERERERSYSFLPGGQFLVNERFGRSPDRDSAVSGTRAFFLFPRPRWLTLEPRTDAGRVTVRLDPVRIVEVDARGLLSQMTGAVIEQEPGVTGTTRGGITFKRFEGVVLDAGWGRGEVAFRKQPDAESTFTDRGGRECRAPNREIFSYRDRLHPTLLFGSDLELSRFLVARCGPEFDVAPLLAGPRRVDVSVHEPSSQVPPPPRRPQPSR
jgi:hypothetical protein